MILAYRFDFFIVNLGLLYEITVLDHNFGLDISDHTCES